MLELSLSPCPPPPPYMNSLLVSIPDTSNIHPHCFLSHRCRRSPLSLQHHVVGTGTFGRRENGWPRDAKPPRGGEGDSLSSLRPITDRSDAVSAYQKIRLYLRSFMRIHLITTLPARRLVCPGRNPKRAYGFAALAASPYSPAASPHWLSTPKLGAPLTDMRAWAAEASCRVGRIPLAHGNAPESGAFIISPEMADLSLSSYQHTAQQSRLLTFSRMSTAPIEIPTASGILRPCIIWCESETSPAIAYRARGRLGKASTTERRTGALDVALVTRASLYLYTTDHCWGLPSL